MSPQIKADGDQRPNVNTLMFVSVICVFFFTIYSANQMFRYLNNGGTFITKIKYSYLNVSFLRDTVLFVAVPNFFLKINWKWPFRSASSYCCTRTSTHVHGYTCSHTHAHTHTDTHAGLFLGHLASSAELPAEFLVHTEVPPFELKFKCRGSWNSSDSSQMRNRKQNV